MKLELNTWQRVMLFTVIGQLRGNVRLLREAMRVLDILEMSAEDKKVVGYVEVPTGVQWTDTEHLFPLEFDQESITFIKQAVEGYQQWPAHQAMLVFDLYERLGIDGRGAGGE